MKSSTGSSGSIEGKVTRQLWHDRMSSEAVLEHYGYEDTEEAHVAMSFWTKDSMPERIRTWC